jgi:hypothetical protein
VPRINPDDYLDFDNEDSLDIQDDEPVTVSGRKPAPKPTKEDRDWEERRKALIQNRLGRDRD